MTNNWVDIKNANLIIVQGGNPAEAHPVGFRWAIEAKKTVRKSSLLIRVLTVQHPLLIFMRQFVLVLILRS